MKPDDKQDVKLAYDLLREIWMLLALPDSSRPGFADTRTALNTLGSFLRHLLLPYICIDLSLSEQLIHLSAAAHMLLAMAHKDRAGTQLMPTQLDIMIMIKNVYFCVAKIKVDKPSSKFYLILLGTDRLEEFFGQRWVQTPALIFYSLFFGWGEQLKFKAYLPNIRNGTALPDDSISLLLQRMDLIFTDTLTTSSRHHGEGM